MDMRSLTAKIAELLHEDYNGVVCFDVSSYDDINDMPEVIIFGDKMRVDEFRVSRDGCELSLICGDDKYTLDLAQCSYTDEELISMGLLDLLREVYYHTPYADECGDFDVDFIKE